MRLFTLKTIKLLSLLLLPVLFSHGVVASQNEAAPHFEAKDAAGNAVDLSVLRGRYIVLEWTNADCPFVKKHYSGGGMQLTQQKLRADGVCWIQIISSAPGKQGYLTPNQAAVRLGQTKDFIDFLVCDASGEIGRLYGALTTPHVYLIDPSGSLIYQGAIDSIPSTRSSDVPSAKNYLMSAYLQSKDGQSVIPSATTPYGCSIKYAQP